MNAHFVVGTTVRPETQGRRNIMTLIRGIFAALAAVLITTPIAQAQRGGPSPVIIEPVELTAFSDRIEAVGTLFPKERVELSVNVSDRVTGVYFEDGERVRRGQTLLVQAQVEQLAEIEAAEATVREAKNVVDRMAPLVDEGVVSGLQFDEANRDFQVAQSNLTSVQARQKDRVLVAPFSGILGFRQVSTGAFLNPGDPVATLIDDSELFLDLAIPDTFLSNIYPGLTVSATSRSLPGEEFNGELVSLDNQIDPATRSLRVRALVPNPDLKLIPGLYLNVTLYTSPREALSVAEGAIEPLGSKSFVYIAEHRGDETYARRVEVTIGSRLDGRAEILSGLQEGQFVITEGLIRVRDGAAIAPQISAITGGEELISSSPSDTSVLRVQ